VNTRGFGSKSSLQVLPRGVSMTAWIDCSSAHVGIFTRFGKLAALRGAYRIGHVRSSHADRLRRTRCGVSGGLVLHLGIELGPWRSKIAYSVNAKEFDMVPSWSSR
jgi:hypothetical protein